MNREIKFRLWDKKRKKMFEVQNLAFHDLYGYKAITIEEDTEGGDSHSTFISTEDCELLEYTGLKDKNGVKIYEGDTLKWYSQVMIKTEWEGTVERIGAEFVVRTSDRAYSTGAFLNSACREEANQMEVIGNIFDRDDRQVSLF